VARRHAEEREALARETRAKTLFIEPESPWENGYIESFNGKMRDELPNGEIFDALLEAKPIFRCSSSSVRHPDSPHRTVSAGSNHQSAPEIVDRHFGFGVSGFEIPKHRFGNEVRAAAAKTMPGNLALIARSSIENLFEDLC